MSVAAEALRFLNRLQGVDCKPPSVMMEIDGLRYTSSKIPASIMLDLMPRVVSMLGAGATRAIALGQAPDSETVTHMIAGIADRAARDGLSGLVMDLLSRVKVNRTRSNPDDGGPVLEYFDTHFAGEYGHLLKVCVFAVAHNLRGPTYGDQPNTGRPKQSEASEGQTPSTAESEP